MKPRRPQSAAVAGRQQRVSSISHSVVSPRGGCRSFVPPSANPQATPSVPCSPNSNSSRSSKRPANGVKKIPHSNQVYQRPNFKEEAIPHPTMKSDPKQRMLEHPPEPAHVAPTVESSATAAAAEVPQQKPTKPASDKAPASGAIEPDANHASDVAALPSGWQKLESRKYPGMYYYLGPGGERQWSAPHHTKEQQRAKKAKLQTIYRADYRHWEDLEKFNPPTLEADKKPSASYAQHPIAPKEKLTADQWGVSLKQKDHRPFSAEEKAPTALPTTEAQQIEQHKLWPLRVVAPFGCTSSYRADFTSQQSQRVARPQSARTRTPPRQLSFDHNSTNRADYIDHKPKKPALVHPAPQLHFNQGGPINSTNRADFVNHGQRFVASARKPKYFKDPGWVRNVKSTRHGATTFTYSKDGLATFSHRPNTTTGGKRISSVTSDAAAGADFYQSQIMDPLDGDSEVLGPTTKPAAGSGGPGFGLSSSSGCSRNTTPVSEVSASAAEDLQRVLKESNEEQLRRGVPVYSGKLPGDFNSTYLNDFVPGDQIWKGNYSSVPSSVCSRSREVDKRVVKRVKAHQALRGLE